MWIDLLASGPQESFVFNVKLSDVGESARVRIPVAITGRWIHPANQREIVITAGDIGTAVRNFRKKSNGEINVDFDHASEIPNFAGGARPSAGRVVELCGPEPYTDPKGGRRQILWGGYEPTQRARAMIRQREYRYISPVLQRERVDKTTGAGQGMTITTIALTNTPVLEEMPAIFCSEGGRMVRCAEVEWPERSQPQKSAVAQNASEELNRLAKERAEKDGLGFEDAFLKVGRENPELYRRSCEAVKMDAPTQYGTIKDVQPEGSRTAVPESNKPSQEMHQRAVLRSKNEGVDYQTAFSEVAREDPELARRYQKQIGRED